MKIVQLSFIVFQGFAVIKNAHFFILILRKRSEIARGMTEVFVDMVSFVLILLSITMRDNIVPTHFL